MGDYIKKTEKISFYSHAFGVLLALIGTIILIYLTRGKMSYLIISLIYGIANIILFLASSIYHFFKQEEGETSFWRKFDHFAIFIMIAGTYTPVCFVYLSGNWKWSIIILQWLLVLGGFFFKFFYLKAPRYLYTLIYLLMGWIGIIPIKMFINSMPTSALFYLFAGGLAYTVGALFYLIKKPVNLFHEIFHFFILVGAFLHYLLVFNAITG